MQSLRDLYLRRRNEATWYRVTNNTQCVNYAVSLVILGLLIVFLSWSLVFSVDRNTGWIHLGQHIFPGIFESLCNTPYDQDNPASGEQSGHVDNKDSGRGGAASTPPNATRSGCNKRKSGGGGGGGGGSGEDPDRGNGRPERSKPSAKKSDKTERKRKLACPMFLNNLSEHRCKGYLRVGDVRLHIFRKHMQPKHCPNCGTTFKGVQAEASRDAHVRSRNCILTIIDCPGVTRDQWTQICERAKDTDPGGEVSRWRTIWGILFPGVKQPVSPYIEHSDILMIVREMVAEYTCGEHPAALGPTTDYSVRYEVWQTLIWFIRFLELRLPAEDDSTEQSTLSSTNTEMQTLSTGASGFSAVDSTAFLEQTQQMSTHPSQHALLHDISNDMHEPNLYQS